jgi:YVTN family beta-propeller protein
MMSPEETLMFSKRPRNGKVRTPILRNPSRALAAAALVLLSACTFTPGVHNPQPPASETLTRSEGFTNFETEPVRPLELSANGRYLYALNTADDRLEIFDTQGETLRSVGETTVGLRPVALALVGTEVWVVNHLSDSVSVVDIQNPSRPRVIHSLQVGDEPRGIVVAGSKHNRVFVAGSDSADPNSVPPSLPAAPMNWTSQR